MRKSAFTLGICAMVFGASTGVVSTSVDAHEAHAMMCDEVSMNAMKADVQSMPESDAKTKAMEEMQMAEAKWGKKDMSACEAHMQNAMKAMED